MKKNYLIFCLGAIAIGCTFFITAIKPTEVIKEREGILDYYQLLLERQAGPSGKVDPVDVDKVEQQIQNLSSNLNKVNGKTMSWSELGPDNVGGRTLGILADNKHDGWIYAGAASGGIWLSKTGGTSWYHITNNSDFYENICVSSITQTIDGDVYFSTGEGSFGGLRGGGVWRKDKDSTEFRRLSKTNPATAGSAWNNTNFMAASGIKDRVYAGNEGGLYVSDDKGATWTKANISPATIGNCTEIKADADGTVLAVINKKICISTNDGNSFVVSSNGLPNVALVSRLTVAISSKNTNYLYAVYAKNGTNDCYGAYHSLDRGVTWKLIQFGNPYFNPFSDQGWYDICSAVDPENENHLFIGGINLWDWNGPGTNFVQIGWNLHPDLHNLTIDTRTKPYTLIIGCDGGVFKSSDRAKSFYPALKLYTTTQFYSMSASRADNALGGTQDNGSLYIDKNGNTTKAAANILGGDGFFSETSWHDPYEIKFAESQFANLKRNKANSLMQPFYDANALKYIADANGGFSGSGNGQFSSPFTLWEHPLLDSVSHFAIGVRGAIYYTNDATNFANINGARWFKLASFGGNVNCVEFSADGDMLFFGVGNTLYRVKGINTANFDSTFDSSPAAHGIRFDAMPFNSLGTSVEGVSCDLKYTNRLLVSTGNYGYNDHIFISHNADDISSNVKFNSIQNNLPSFPCYDAALDYSDSNTFIVGTEYGAYVTYNGGATWSEQNTGLSRVAVYQVRQYIDTRQPWTGSTYYLATFGRGMFRSTSLTTGIKNTSVQKPIHAFSVFPNPAVTIISVEGLHIGMIHIYDMQGKCVISKMMQANESIDISGIGRGNYIFEMIENGKPSATKFVKL
jgi:photosystem II stability/assembly factor-like uncharacterized protein